MHRIRKGGIHIKIVRLMDGRVYEILPSSVYEKGVEYWYGAEFAAQCVDAPDYVEQNWSYNPDTNTFSEPTDPAPAPVIPTTTELAAENKILTAQVGALSDRNEFIEDCIAEMAMLIYQ